LVQISKDENLCDVILATSDANLKCVKDILGEGKFDPLYKCTMVVESLTFEDSVGFVGLCKGNSRWKPSEEDEIMIRNLGGHVAHLAEFAKQGRAGYQQCVSNELEALRTAQKDARPSSFWGRTPGTYTLDEFSRVMNDIAYNDSVAYDTLAREVGVEPAVVDAMLERNFLFYHPTRRVIMHRSPLFKVVFATKKRRKN